MNWKSTEVKSIASVVLVFINFLAITLLIVLSKLGVSRYETVLISNFVFNLLFTVFVIEVGYLIMGERIKCAWPIRSCITISVFMIVYYVVFKVNYKQIQASKEFTNFNQFMPMMLKIELLVLIIVIPACFLLLDYLSKFLTKTNGVRS